MTPVKAFCSKAEGANVQTSREEAARCKGKYTSYNKGYQRGLGQGAWFKAQRARKIPPGQVRMISIQMHSFVSFYKFILNSIFECLFQGKLQMIFSNGVSPFFFAMAFSNRFYGFVLNAILQRPFPTAFSKMPFFNGIFGFHRIIPEKAEGRAVHTGRRGTLRSRGIVLVGVVEFSAD